METRSTLLPLQPGMYVLRHPGKGLAPLSVSLAPGGSEEGKINSVSTERTGGAILRDGGDCIVMHVSVAPVTLLVCAFLKNSDDPVPALRLDQIAYDQAPQSSALPGAPIQIGEHGISLIGHIERTGDVVAAPGASLGDPLSGLRLEGFQVEWPDRPRGVDLVYRIATEGAGALPAVKSGKYCGTRGEARRITAVSFALTGTHSDQWRLSGEAVFSGGYTLPVSSGQMIAGPSGLEHLTALTLGVQPASVSEDTGNPWKESVRTKVFRHPDATLSPKPAPAKKAAARQSAKK